MLICDPFWVIYVLLVIENLHTIELYLGHKGAGWTQLILKDLKDVENANQLRKEANWMGKKSQNSE